jgi:IMP dehydrogenase
MTRDNLITVQGKRRADEAKRLLHSHRIEKLLVVDGHGRCVGLITVKDIEKSQLNPNAAKDEQGRCALPRPPPLARMGSSAPSA